MTHPLPPDPARFSALLAPPRKHHLAVCLCDTTALSPSLCMLAAMYVSFARGNLSQAAFPEAVLAPGRRWSFPSGAAAVPAACGGATPHAQRSPAGVGRATTESGPAGALQEASATPHAQRQAPAIAVVPAESTSTSPARVTAIPHAQRSQTDIPAEQAELLGAGPARRIASPHVQRSPAGEEVIDANLRPTAPPILGPVRGPSLQAEGEYFALTDAPARQHPMPSGSRGRLKNGAPGGDYLAAPRCGARTRAGGSCQQPAMPNGRCRLHGGKSTGARTEAGRERLRSIHTRHGGYGRDSLAWFRRVDAFIAETKQFMAENRHTSAVAAAVPPAAGGPSGQSFPRAGRSQPTPGGDPGA